MATLQNSRKHDLVCNGLTLPAGASKDVSDAEFVALGDNPVFQSWVSMGWVGIAQYSEAQLRQLQQEAAAKEKAAQAEREAALAKQQANVKDVQVHVRENALEAELKRARERVKQGQGRPAQGPDGEQRIGQYPTPPNEHGQPQHNQDSRGPGAGVASPGGHPLTAQQPGTLTGPQPVVPGGPAPGGSGTTQNLQSADTGRDDSHEGRDAQTDHSRQAQERSEVASKNEQSAREAGAKSGKK